MRRIAALFLSILAACTGPVPAEIPTEYDHLVVVKTIRLPDYMDWYTRFAEHSWIDLKDGNENAWTRIEIDGVMSGVVIEELSAEDARANERWDNPVFVLESFHGVEAQDLIPRVLESANAVTDFGYREMFRNEDTWAMKFIPPTDGRLYDAWPGPNSNTLIAQIIDRTAGLHAELHHNGVGKDYPDVFRAGITASGLGVEADFGQLGLGLGFRQGVELHLAGLTAGLSLWPPALKLPFLPRIGVHQGWVGKSY
ncbi:MAG: DUF3750 domain-containing protein [Planctomycetes bacterium]|nr:DUF3750 domain-containing protein [Planctomycetota bacterium]MCP4771727.1 DUF3750 domain-containing protein [Planctomycetota bacterium]MCP4859973.1 DUF3750 domain-containing protein [Planctomycetota bacterium]